MDTHNTDCACYACKPKSFSYTNISTAPLGILDGLPIKPCMKSGFCCATAPCGYGERKSTTDNSCKFLATPNDLGQRDCLRYEWIIANVPDYKFYPGFGTGCCMPMFNEIRQDIITKIESWKQVF